MSHVRYPCLLVAAEPHLDQVSNNVIGELSMVAYISWWTKEATSNSASQITIRYFLLHVGQALQYFYFLFFLENTLDEIRTGLHLKHVHFTTRLNNFDLLIEQIKKITKSIVKR